MAAWYRAIISFSALMASLSTAVSGNGVGGVPSAPMPLHPAASSGNVMAAAASTLRRPSAPSARPLRSAGTGPPAMSVTAAAERRGSATWSCTG